MGNVKADSGIIAMDSGICYTVTISFREALMRVRKKTREVFAYCLGAGSAVERQMIRAGKIRPQADGTYRVLSQENDREGQIAQAGDYFKVDGAGAPYPNGRAYFLANHTPLGDDRYLQTAPVLNAWCLEEPDDDAICFLMDSGRLFVDETDPAHCFRAFLWGAWLTAAWDAVIIFDKVEWQDGAVVDASFRFITREEFDRTYEVL